MDDAPHCCSPSRPADTTAAASTEAFEGPVAIGSTPAASHDDVVLPGATFTMGDAFDEGYAPDGEIPVHRVTIGPFRIDQTQVTNDAFAMFVEATGHVTEAERFGDAAVFHPLIQAGNDDVLGASGPAPWWRLVRGADWRHPYGPRSDLHGRGDHPVVQISWNDAMAYCHWAGRRLPTEAEWEYAARGGLPGARYPWGDDLLGSSGEHRCNIWQGRFPTDNTAEDGHVATSPVTLFPPNGFGLYDMAGNVWDWCADWYSPHTYRADAEREAGGSVLDPRGPSVGAARVMRGGSYLCHQSYCNRYRVAARSFNTPNSASGNCGFRTTSGPTPASNASTATGPNPGEEGPLS
jgi:formylglycine-generating enzyme required for sulfatase activity